MREIDTHHDGHGLNESIVIQADDQDPDAGNGSHRYEFVSRANGETLALIQFQHGPRGDALSTPGVTGGAVLAALIDHLEGFQTGPYKSRETALVITKLEEALLWTNARSDRRAKRGVLGKAKA